MGKLVDEGIFALDHDSGFCAAKSLYPDARSFCEAVIKEKDSYYGEHDLGDIDYLVRHTIIGYVHHCVGYRDFDDIEPGSWWQVEYEPGRGRSPVWYLDLD
jgi:hypothetical protein